MLMQGWLRIRRLWRARKRSNDKFACKFQWPLMWHVLKPGSVELYQSADESELLMQIQLCATTELMLFSTLTPRRAAAEGLQEAKLSFCITDALNRCRYFKAETSEMLQQWVQAFQVASSLFDAQPSAAPLNKTDEPDDCTDPPETEVGTAAAVEDLSQSRATPENDEIALSPSTIGGSNGGEPSTRRSRLRRRESQQGTNAEMQDKQPRRKSSVHFADVAESQPENKARQEDDTLSAASDGLVLAFRFVNYNMANHELNLDSIGNGFATQRFRAHKAPDFKGDADEGGGDAARSVPFDELIAQGVPALEETYDDAHEASFAMTSTIPKKLEKSDSRFLGMIRGKTQEKLSPDSKGASPDSKGGSSQAAPVSPKHSPRPAGSTADCVFGTFCETKLNVSRYDGHLLTCGSRICHTHAQSARQILTESGNVNERLKAAVANSLNGDLRTVHVCSSKLVEVESGKVFCSFDETGGMSKSNPMKCFLGRSFDAVSGGVRFIILGSHFPMSEIGKTLLDETLPEEELILRVKSMVASNLKKILKHVFLQGLLTSCTVLILQGDLNSRTILARDGQNKSRFVDLISETLRDTDRQNSIAEDIPEELRGTWQEVIEVPDPGQLPVTYRFDTQGSAVDKEFFDLTLSQVYGDMRQDSVASEAETAKTPRIAAYRAVLDQLGSKVDEWGLYHPKGDAAETKFKPGRLPACTERVLYYTPAAFKGKCHWQASRGYEVNYKQQGSDHKPVILEAEVYIGEKMPKHLRRTSSDVNAESILFRPRKRTDTSAEDVGQGPTGFFGRAPWSK